MVENPRNRYFYNYNLLKIILFYILFLYLKLYSNYYSLKTIFIYISYFLIAKKKKILHYSQNLLSIVIYSIVSITKHRNY